jgi:F-type H+-transporting ATPase subunit alpha
MNEVKYELIDTGYVQAVGDGVASVQGLTSVQAGELVNFEGGVAGIVLNLEPLICRVVIFGNERQIWQGQKVSRSYQMVSIPVGDSVWGRIIDPLGNALDGKEEIDYNERSLVEVKAPGIIERQSISSPLQTGILAIDTLLPIGRGQRELIIGDRQMGKTSVALDTIIHQGMILSESEVHTTQIHCIYVAIGQKRSSVAEIVRKLEAWDALDYTTIISATASDAAALQFLAPYSGAAIGEYLRDNENHALIIYDDLSKHAVAYRQISLLLRRPPGREAYPGDVFYLHARLLERAAQMSDAQGAGSLTALPIIETQAGDVSAYITSNVISITDGQIFLESELFYRGIRPAINIGLSVSRVGSAAQVPAMRAIIKPFKSFLSKFRVIEGLVTFGFEVEEDDMFIYNRGLRLIELLKQPTEWTIPVEFQIILIESVLRGWLDNIPTSRIQDFKDFLINHFSEADEDWFINLEGSTGLPEEVLDFVENLTVDYQFNLSYARN